MSPNANTSNNNAKESAVTVTIQEVLPNPIKGDSDWRSYRCIKLQNGVTCVFVHDKESKTTACSVCVGAGASHDPRELSGLAHFTEHMCFLGSEAYPVENEFKKYLSSHGGRSNASTSMNQTVYKFDILAEHAERAIDIFSNFFIAPLFTQSGTDRELNAVDSENSKNMSNDGRRRLQILKALANPEHHYSKFSTGNAQTLSMVGVDSSGNEKEEEKEEKGEEVLLSQNTFVREALLAFHRRHYRPDNYTVVVVGPQKLEKLEEWIVPRFGSIVSRWEGKKDEKEMSEAELLVDKSAADAPNDTFGSLPVPHDPPFHTKFQSNTWPILLTTLPLQAVKKMYLFFPLPSVKELEDQSPYHIISHLLGHEGPGSCFAVLQDAELIDAISVGPRLSEADHSLLQINISLTERGENKWEDVVSTIFDYCYLLYDTVKKAKEQQQRDDHGSRSNEALDHMMRIWGEVQRVKSSRFHQTSPGHAIGLAPSLAGSVRQNGTKRSLSIGSLLSERDDGSLSLPLDQIYDFVKQLTPQNCLIEHCSQSAWERRRKNSFTEDSEKEQYLFGLKKEKWYGVDYYLTSIDQNTVQEWNHVPKSQKPLHLPKENQYIPTDLSLCSELPEEATKHPRIDKEIEPPNLLINDKEFGRLWHRLDDRYCLPKASLTLLLRNAAVQHKWDTESNLWTFDPMQDAQSELLTDIFLDALAQKTYSAQLAGLSWSLSKLPSGLVIKCSGYSQHLTSFALDIVTQFFCKESSFISERNVRTNTDKMIRHYQSYLQSKRADTYASYYTKLLMNSRGFGVQDSLSLTKNVSLEGMQKHHQRLTTLSATKVECLVSGNVSSKEAESFFLQTQKIINNAKLRCKDRTQLNKGNKNNFHKWIPGPFVRAMREGEDVHLHFQSQNPEEQNGAVRMTFQSQTPGFKGFDSKPSSMNESLVRTAALRVLCHIMKEPLFNQLRTKEQLGYIVNSSYNIDFSFQSWNSRQADGATLTPIDSVVINVLSKKVSPPILTHRIDEFLVLFREKIIKMTEEEIQSHTDALSKNLLKPIQKLHAEVNEHFSNIRRYSPECIDRDDGQLLQLMSDRKKHLAQAIQGLSRSELLHTFDAVLAGKKRTRIVSHVYGKKFNFQPIGINNTSTEDKLGRKICHIQSTSELFQKRQTLARYGTSSSRAAWISGLSKNGIFLAAGITAGAGLFLCSICFPRGEKVDQMKLKK